MCVVVTFSVMSQASEEPKNSGDGAGPLFPSLQEEAEAAEGITSIESLCMQCHGQVRGH